MTAPLLSEFYLRDLFKVKEELLAYTDEKDIWRLTPGILNTAGNLSLHISGNLLHFIGATLGNTGYVRNRELEFAARGLSRSDLLVSLDDAIHIIQVVLPGLSNEELEKNFPLEKHGQTVTIHHMLVHLLAHLSYHLGQINYHRRMIPVAS